MLCGSIHGHDIFSVLIQSPGGSEMFDRRYAHMASTIYSAAIAATLIVGATTAFLIVLIVGGPVTGMMYSRSSPGRRRE